MTEVVLPPAQPGTVVQDCAGGRVPGIEGDRMASLWEGYFGGGVPVIVIAPKDSLFEKTASNMQEVIARGGRVIFMSDTEGMKVLGKLAAATVALPVVNSFVAPILYAIPVQLLAYHTAVLKGTDVDQPRNLAKSVGQIWLESQK